MRKTEILQHQGTMALTTIRSGLPAQLGNCPERVQFHGNILNIHVYMWWKENEIKYKHESMYFKQTYVNESNNLTILYCLSI